MSETDRAWAIAAAQARRETGAFSLPDPDMRFARAYALQDHYVANIGAAIGGYKLAVNGKALMAHFGVDEPVSARVFAPEIHSGGIELLRPGFMEVSIEPELVAVLGSSVADLDGPVDLAGTIGAIDRFHAGIELIDQRGIAMPDIRLPQAIALNVFNAGCVLGDGSLAPGELDIANLHVTLTVDGEIVAETTGTAPQDPVDAVMWLINHLVSRGLRPEPGMIVMCGTHLPLYTLAAGAGSVRVAMSGLGSAGFKLTG